MADSLNRIIIGESAPGIATGIQTPTATAQNNQASDCILTNLKTQVAKGASGPLLMHSVYKLTLDTLPAIVSYRRAEGFVFVTAEQLIRDKYGMGSDAIMAARAEQELYGRADQSRGVERLQQEQTDSGGLLTVRGMQGMQKCKKM